MTRDKKPQPMPFDAVLAELQSMVPVMTSAQWDARDKEVAAARVDEALFEARVQLDSSEGERRMTNAMKDRGWPDRAIGDAFSADLEREAIVKMRDRDPRYNITVLSGAVGCGKTVAAARWCIDEQPEALFVRASTMARTSRYDAAAIAPWYGARAIVLDDLGTEYLDVKGSYLVDLAELIDTYHGTRKPMVITTNCVWRDFDARYGERIADRLHESAEWISISAASMRSGR